MRRFRTLFLLLGLILMNSSDATEQIHTPEPGSAERLQLLDAARAAIKRKLGRDVQFVVEQVRVGDGWGFLYAHMEDADGKPIDYAGTPLADSAREGYVSPDYVTLLRREGDAWTPAADVIGPTDMVWLSWPEKYGAPHALFED